MESDGSSPGRITESSIDAMAPAISPDGTTIASHTDRDGEENLYAVGGDAPDLGPRP